MTTEPGIPELPEPPAPAAQPPPLPPRIKIEEVSQTKRKWILELHPDHIALHSEFEPRPWVFTRAEMWDKVELLAPIKVLAVRKPRAINFKLSPEALAAFKRWLGPLTSADLRKVLKKRYSWVLPIAFIIAITSLPMSGDPAQGIKPVPVDPLGLALGVLLGGIWVWARYRPMRIIFLVDAVWFAFVAGRNILNVLGGSNKWWLLFSAWLLLLAFWGVKWFAHFGPMREPENRPQSASSA